MSGTNSPGNAAGSKRSPWRKALIAVALVATVGLIPVAATARGGDHGNWAGHDRPWHGGDRYYGANGGYSGPGHDGRRYHHCNRVDGGTIIGAIAGGLLGNSLAGRGDRGIDTAIGAGAGALAGRSIDRGC